MESQRTTLATKAKQLVMVQKERDRQKDYKRRLIKREEKVIVITLFGSVYFLPKIIVYLCNMPWRAGTETGKKHTHHWFHTEAQQRSDCTDCSPWQHPSTTSYLQTPKNNVTNFCMLNSDVSNIIVSLCNAKYFSYDMNHLAFLSL